MKNRKTFYETQKFNQPLLWIGLLGFLLFLFYGVYLQLVMGEPLGDRPMSNVGLGLTTFFYALLILLFIAMKLDLQIEPESIHVRYFPFFRKEIRMEEVQTLEVINYGFVGWGIRYSFRYGIVYNIRGNKGLLITLKNGKKYCIGTQKAKELESFLSIGNT